MTDRRRLNAWLPSSLLAQCLVAFVGGVSGVLGFAPFYFWPMTLVSLAVLFALWGRSATAKGAFFLGVAWGLGLFLTGVSWIYVSLHVYGNMPAILAGLATLLFCCYLALYPALAGVLYRLLATRLTLSAVPAWLLLMPACFVLFEYLRGWVMSGFPWLTFGYSQTPGGVIATPLAGYAAVFGVYGISWILAIVVSLLLLLAGFAVAPPLSHSRRFIYVLLLVLVVGAGLLLFHISWSEASGKSLRVALLQGNVEQSLKWREDQRGPTLANYQHLVLASRAKLIVLPETALPDLLDRIPTEYLESIRQHALREGADVLMGVPIVEGPTGANARYHVTNSAVSAGTSPSQRYDKQHLVAFGEFVPPLFAWVYQWLQIPMSDFNPRSDEPRPMRLAGHSVAVNICYEDTFGREIAAQLPEAELLVNVSNMAWFGASLAAEQHLQMSQMRALETARWMLRATNTGATAAINEKGQVVKSLPAFTRGALEVDAQPLAGATPYSRWRDLPVLTLLVFCLLLSGLFRRASSAP